MASNATLHDATTPPATAAPLAAGILHVPITTDAEAFGRVARASDRVLVHLAEAGAEQRGSLARVVVAGIEAALDQLGAAPGGWAAADTLEEIARDQLYRARLLGYFGVALSFAPLTALADASGRLSAEDSETLRRLLALAEREPLQLYLPRPSSELLIAGAPQPLATWLPASGVPGRVATIEYDPASVHEAETPLPPESGPGVALLPPPLDAFVQAALDSSLVEAPTPLDAADVAAACEPCAIEQPAATDAPAPSLADLTPPACEPESSEAATPLPAVAATDAERAERCAAWAAQLRGMSGPKVHGSIEKAFVSAYLPLRHELAGGAAPEQARHVAERWAEGFAQSYASAFRQLGASGRRPRMVRDVVELSSRWLGQYHARQCQLLLVSAMRFDLGQRLNEELERHLAGGGVCVDQSVLWTALPSNAEAQQLGEAVGLARRGRQDPQPPRLAALAGGSGPAIESGYVGSRELLRLRQLPDELARPGEPEEARLRRLATELGATIVPWMLRQPPDTLVVIFGDHGFHWDVSPIGTSPAQRGGALPEQVLVPASAWLLREPRPRPKTAPGVH